MSTENVQRDENVERTIAEQAGSKRVIVDRE